MTPKTLILIVVAATCGLIGSSMTTGLFAERRPHDSEKPPFSWPGRRSIGASRSKSRKTCLKRSSSSGAKNRPAR